MSIQNIIDKAQEIEIDRRRVIGQTISRSQRVKTAERSTAQPWKFKVTPPASLSWADSRGFIEIINLRDRVEEYEISLNNNPGMNYITAYQGDLNQTMLNSITISTATTATMVLTGLPSIGSELTRTSVSITAQSFTTATNNTYARALSMDRYDFLITNHDYDTNFRGVQPGNRLSTSTYLTGWVFIPGLQSISTVTRNYITIKGVGYTRIVMNEIPNDYSPVATIDGGDNISILSTSSVLVSSSTVILRPGDIVQPANSRYPYAVTNTVVRGSGSTVTVNLNRPIVTSESISLNGESVLVGNSCSWRVVVASLPTYKLIPNKRVQYTGDFEVVEKVI